MLTPNKIVKQAEYWLGYREKNHANADLENFQADAGNNNYTIFSVLCGYGIQPWQWCQLFVCSLFVKVCGGISEAKKALYDTDNNGVLTSYTPQGAQYFKNAGRWYTTPQVGDVVYFYGNVSSEGRSRICHTGIVTSVDKNNKIFGTIEGNSNHDGFTTNGGCVARHEYSYANVGGGNRVNGFGRPAYNYVDESGVYLKIGGQNMAATYKLEEIKRGDKGNSVLLLQEILKSRGQYKGELDKQFGPATEKAVIDYQTARIKMGAKLGDADGIVGPKTWNDLLALSKA